MDIKVYFPKNELISLNTTEKHTRLLVFDGQAIFRALNNNRKSNVFFFIYKGFFLFFFALTKFFFFFFFFFFYKGKYQKCNTS